MRCFAFLALVLSAVLIGAPVSVAPPVSCPSAILATLPPLDPAFLNRFQTPIAVTPLSVADRAKLLRVALERETKTRKDAGQPEILLSEDTLTALAQASYDNGNQSFRTVLGNYLVPLLDAVEATARAALPLRSYDQLDLEGDGDQCTVGIAGKFQRTPFAFASWLTGVKQNAKYN